MMSNKNWREVFIPEELFFQEGPGVRNTQFRDTGVKLLNVGNINNGVINLASTKTHLSEEEAFGKYSHFLVDDGDLLIACSGIIVDNFHNKIAFANSTHLPLCLNTSTMRFKPLNVDSLNIIFFKYYLQSEYFKSQLVKLITGSAQLNFGPSHIKKIKIKIPPLEQQKKIAAILDAADAYRQKTKALIAKYDELTQSLFLDMFGNNFNTDLKPLGEVVKFSQGQQFGLELQSFTPKEGYARFLRIIDFTQGDELRYVPNESNKYFVFKDDIVIVRYGASAGFVGTNKEGVLANNLFKVNYDRKVFHQYYLYYIFQNERFKSFVEKEAFGAAMPALSFKVMERFEIPVPPIPLQNQFAERVQAIEEQKAQALASLEKAEELFASLLQKSFKGELV